MSGLAARRQAIQAAAAALAAVAVVLAGPGLPAQSAVRADPDLGSAQERARRLAAEVDALEIRAEQAVEAYNDVQSRLAAAVTSNVSASRRLDAARQAGQGRRSAAERSVRAVYMAGGQAALYGTLLDGRDPADVLARAGTVALVLRQQDASADRGEAEARELAAATDQLASAADQASALERQAGEAAAAVRAVLDARAGELAAADEQVRRLAEEARRKAEAEAAARAAALLGTGTGGQVAPGVWPDGLPAPAGPAGPALAAARSRLGLPYVWGATGPDSFDCSGLTGWAYRQAGLALPRTSREQWLAGTRIGLPELQPGDLLFWATDVRDPGSIHHVALYAGAGWMLEAPRSGQPLRVARVYLDGYIGAVRPGSRAPA